MQNAKCKMQRLDVAGVLHSAFCILHSAREHRAWAPPSLEEIVFDDRQLRRGGRAPALEDVQVEQHEDDLAAHFPAGAEAGEEAALRLFDDVAEVMDHGV